MLTTRTLISTHTLFSSPCMDGFMFISLSLSFHLYPRISVFFYPPSSSISFPLYLRSLSLSFLDLFSCLSTISFTLYPPSLSMSIPDLFPSLFRYLSIHLYISKCLEVSLWHTKRWIKIRHDVIFIQSSSFHSH